MQLLQNPLHLMLILHCSIYWSIISSITCTTSNCYHNHCRNLSSNNYIHCISKTFYMLCYTLWLCFSVTTKWLPLWSYMAYYVKGHISRLMQSTLHLLLAALFNLLPNSYATYLVTLIHLHLMILLHAYRLWLDIIEWDISG